MQQTSPANRKRWPKRLVMLLAVGVAIPTSYFASYCLALGGKVYVFDGVDPVSGVNHHRIEPSFRFCDIASSDFYKPAFWIDRHIRGEYWNTIENKLTGKKWKNP